MADGEGGFIDVAGGPVEYRFEPASPDGAHHPPLVFLHEGLGSIELWRSFPAAVRAGTGHPAALAFNRHGYGRSAPAVLPRPVEYMHHEALVVLPEVLGAFAIARPVLVGHSDGASIALVYAGAGNDVAAVVAIAPHVYVEDSAPGAIASARRRYETTDMGARLGRYHADADATFYGWNDVWGSAAFRSWDITGCLAGITCPVLVVQGDADEYGSVAQVDAVESGLADGCARLVLTGGGHSPHLESPDVVVPAVVEFVLSARAG